MADQSNTQTTANGPATTVRSRSRSKTATARRGPARSTAGNIPGSTAFLQQQNVLHADAQALDRLTTAYVRGGNGQRTLGTCNLLEFIAWANEYTTSSRPRTMTAGSGGGQQSA